MPLISGHRWLILRRAVQVSILLLFAAGNAYGLKVLQGNLSSSRVLGAMPLADPYALLQVLFTGTPVSAEGLLGGAVVALFFAVLGGRAFCSWVCPLNMVTDLAGSLRRRTGYDRREPSLPVSRSARYWTFGLGLALSSMLGIAAFEWISPLSMLHRGLVYGMGAGWTLIAAVFLFDLAVLRQGFCGHLCPLGAFHALAGRFGLLRVRHTVDRCNKCMICRDRCPEPQVLALVGMRSGEVASGECTRCGRCVDVCPDDALSFGIRSFGRTTGENKGG